MRANSMKSRLENEFVQNIRGKVKDRGFHIVTLRKNGISIDKLMYRLGPAFAAQDNGVGGYYITLIRR